MNPEIINNTTFTSLVYTELLKVQGSEVESRMGVIRGWSQGKKNGRKGNMDQRIQNFRKTSGISSTDPVHVTIIS